MKKILLADDEKDLREGLKIILSKLVECSIFLAEDGKAAVAAAKREDFDLLIMDYQMPCMNGLEAIKAIRARRPGIKVLLMSSFDTGIIQKKAAEVGVKVDVLLKKDNIVANVALLKDSVGALL